MPGMVRSKAAWFGVCVAAAAITALLIGSAPDMARAAASRLGDIKAHGTLRAAGVVYQPLITRKPDGSYEGMDMDVMSMIARDLGVKLQIVDAGWDTAVAGITTGKWDIVPTICITPKRQEVVDFTDPYLQLDGAIIVAADNSKHIQSVADADKPDVVFADVAGGWGEEFARKAAPHATHKLFSQVTDADMVQEVLSGHADAAVMNTPITTGIIRKTFGDRIRFIPGWDQPLGIQPCPVAYAIPKGDEALRSFLNMELEKFKADGTMGKLLDRWLSSASLK